jgi:hypothetical protein
MQGKEQFLTIKLPGHMVRRLEEAAHRNNISVAEQAERVLRMAMLEQHPPRTEGETKQEIKESAPDFRRGWRDIVRGSGSGNRRKDDTPGEPRQGGEGTDTGADLQEITLSLSDYRVARLEQLSGERGTSAGDEAARLIRDDLLAHYQAETEEELGQQGKEAAQEVARIWRDIFQHFWSGKKESDKD